MNYFMLGISVIYIGAAIYELFKGSNLWIVYICWAISNAILAGK